MAKTSPTQRSLALLRAQGYTVAKVEYWNPFPKRADTDGSGGPTGKRMDLFGFIDLVCLVPGESGVLAIQTTSATHLAAHRTKALALPACELWLRCGNRIVLHGWAKRGAAGKHKLWQCRVVEVTLADFGVTDVVELAF
jgi:hypothetical protein